MPMLLVEQDSDVQLWDDDSGGATLDDLLSGAWESLAAGSSTACPVCSGALEPRWSAGAGIVGGRCGSCASELS
jgi:hypothetical protein